MATDPTADAELGARRIRWTESNMPLLAEIRQRFTHDRPFDGLTIGMSLHLEPKTGALVRCLRAGGAEIVATGNLGTTQADVVAALNADGITALGHRLDDHTTHLEHVATVANAGIDLILDNGADLAAIVDPSTIRGGTEETTSGGNRLRQELIGRVSFPVIVINDSPLKAIIENEHGVGQSVLESLQRITNLMPQRMRVAVFGYGWCGRGIAHYARQLGCEVTVVEPDAIKALEATMRGFTVRSVEEALALSNVAITATGATAVLGTADLENMPSEMLLANAGHFDDEIDVTGLRAAADDVDEVAPGIERLIFPDGGSVRLLTGGRMVNLGGIEPRGNSIEAMDIGFALQSLSLERVATAADNLTAGAQPVPDDINVHLARRFVELARR